MSLLASKGGLDSVEAWLDGETAFARMHRMKSECGWSAATFNSHRKNMNTYFAFLLRRGTLPENPVRKLEKVRERQRNYAVPTESDVEAVFRRVRSRPCANLLERKRNVLFLAMLAET